MRTTDFGNRVKRVIRRQASRLYLRLDGTWTDAIEDAVEFDSGTSALETQQRLQLKGVELILQVGTEPREEYDVILPLKDFGGSSTSETL